MVQTVELFLRANLVVIHFGYGLVFVLLGFAVALVARYFHNSRLALARSLPYLVAFGMLLGLAEWGVVFIPLQAAYLAPQSLSVLYGVQTAALGVAHGFLFLFGARLTAGNAARGRWLPAAAAVITALWLSWFLAGIPNAAARNSFEAWRLQSHTWATYGLGLPGAGLSAYGLWAQRRELAPYYPRVGRALGGAALAFMISVPLGPLALPVSPGGTAGSLAHIPLQAFLGAGGLILACCIVWALEVFQLENSRRLDDAELRQAVLEERYRIGKELNDGVIQEVYGTGLLLEAVAANLPPEDQQTERLLRTALGQMQDTVRRLRGYILELEPIKWDDPDLVTGVRRLVEEFRANTLLPVQMAAEPGLTAEPDKARALYTVVHEALANIRQHAGASAVEVRLQRTGEGLYLQVQDNGRGLPSDVTPGTGMDRMQRRAEAVGGVLRVEPAVGQGTVVSLKLPTTPELS